MGTMALIFLLEGLLAKKKGMGTLVVLLEGLLGLSSLWWLQLDSVTCTSFFIENAIHTSCNAALETCRQRRQSWLARRSLGLELSACCNGGAQRH
jgi:hypothetical protein